MVDSFLHWSAIAQMLLDNSVQQGFIDLAVPDTFRVNHKDRSAVANAQTGCNPPLYAPGIVVLSQIAQLAGQQRVDPVRLAFRIAERP